MQKIQCQKYFLLCVGLKKVHTVDVDTDTVVYLRNICKMSLDSIRAPWRQQLLIKVNHIWFTIDTGADNVILNRYFTTLEYRPTLVATITVVRSPGGLLDCLRKATLPVVKNKQYSMTVYVVNTEMNDSLLSRKKCSYESSSEGRQYLW